MKKSRKKGPNFDEFDEHGEMSLLNPRAKQKKVYIDGFERESGERAPRRFDQKDFRKVKIKGNQWEEWIV